MNEILSANRSYRMGIFQFLRRPDVKYLDLDVVHFKGRAFPRATLAGDTLWILRHDVNRIARRARDLGDEPLVIQVEALQRKVSLIFDGYNEVCKRFGLGGFKTPDEDEISKAVSGTS